MRDSRIVFGPLSACIRKLCTDYRGGTQQDRGDDAASRTRIGGAWSYGQRRTNAAVTLLRLGEREKVLPVFEMTDDPEALTQFIFRCRPRGVGVDALLDLLQLVAHQPQA